MLTREQRKELVRKCLSSLVSEDAHAFSAWFNFVPMSLLNRENFVEWLYWAIFSSTVEDGEEFMSEVEEYLAEVELHDWITLTPGHAPETKPIRVTLDPVRMLHRPLIWYLVCITLANHEKWHPSQFTLQLVASVDAWSFLVFNWLGFKHYTTGGILRVFPPRPFTLFSNSSPTPLPYWYRPHRSKTKSPVLFLHGIGVLPTSL